MPGEGLEPPHLNGTSTSSLRVYQFHHPGDEQTPVGVNARFLSGCSSVEQFSNRSIQGRRDPVWGGGPAPNAPGMDGPSRLFGSQLAAGFGSDNKCIRRIGLRSLEFVVEVPRFLESPRFHGGGAENRHRNGFPILTDSPNCILHTVMVLWCGAHTSTFAVQLSHHFNAT